MCVVEEVNVSWVQCKGWQRSRQYPGGRLRAPTVEFTVFSEQSLLSFFRSK